MNLRRIMIASILSVLLISFLGWVTAPTPVIATQSEADSLQVIPFNDSVTEHVDASDDIGIDIPSFINRTDNHIDLNGADWTRLRASAANAAALPFSILHLGDSHIQADISTATMRNLLQYDYGSAGRGLIVPLRLASTNQPWDYTFKSPSHWNITKLLRRPWVEPVGFSGVTLRPSSINSSITVATKEDCDTYDPFRIITLLHSGNLAVADVTDADGSHLAFNTLPAPGGTHIELDRETTSAKIDLEGSDYALHAVNLSAAHPGVFYHTIGNNGATYAAYAQVPGLGSGISSLSPDLIIISMGTNEAFGRFNRESFLKSLDRLVTDIRKANPTTPILLTTPMECQKSVASPTSRGRYHSRKSSRSSMPNATIAEVRSAILDYGRSHRLATYDWYDVAGGRGASSLWVENGLFSSDKVHHSVKGYRLQGFLLYEALKHSLSTNSLSFK